MRLKSTIYESTLSTADAVPLPRVGKGASEVSRIGFWRYEKERGNASQVRRLREYPIHRWRGPPSPMGKAKRRRLRRKKGSQPRLAALGSPFQGKGLAWILPPSYGRRCPEGAEVGWGKRYPRHKAFPNGEGCDTRMPLFSTQRFSQWGRQRGGGFAAQKGSQPRLAALGSALVNKNWTRN